jgi:hypothetical protein
MRRSFVTVGLALLVGASVVQAQSQQQTSAAPPASQTPAAAPAQTPAPAPDLLKFTSDEAMMVMQIAAGKSADFEASWTDMLTTMAASDKPGVKELAASMHTYKVNAPGMAADQPSIYVVQVTGASKTLSYNYGKIIFYAGNEAGAAYAGIYPTQEAATAVYTKIKDSIVPNGINPWPLSKIGG